MLPRRHSPHVRAEALSRKRHEFEPWAGKDSPRATAATASSKAASSVRDEPHQQQQVCGLCSSSMRATDFKTKKKPAYFLSSGSSFEETTTEVTEEDDYTRSQRRGDRRWRSGGGSTTTQSKSWVTRSESSCVMSNSGFQDGGREDKHDEAEAGANNTTAKVAGVVCNDESSSPAEVVGDCGAVMTAKEQACAVGSDHHLSAGGYVVTSGGSGGSGGSVASGGGSVAERALVEAQVVGKRGKVEALLDEAEITCWRWLVSNAGIIVILLVFSNMETRGEQQQEQQQQQLTLSALSQKILGVISVLSSVISLVIIFVVGVSSGFWWRAQHQKTTTESLQSPKVMRIEEVQNSSSNDSVCSRQVSLSPKGSGLNVGNIVQQYTLKEIASMTNDFKEELGRGGQGIVYAAMLPGEPKIRAAVKKLQRNDGVFVGNPDKPVPQTLEKEFWAELKTISRLHHGNLVALLGYCVEGRELFLIYELMSNGSLEQHLHKCDSGLPGATFLDWRARMRVAIDVAQGLEYLHRHAHPHLVHRDIKSSNILFDDNMQAKIADFGLSKALIVGHDPTASHRVRGTAGYVDPSYLKTGRPVDKNDVYSFGVLLLELITGRKAIQQKVSLVTWCKEFFTNDPSLLPVLLPRMVDRGILHYEYTLDQLQNVVKVARACLDENQERRLSMKEVIIALYNATTMEDVSSSEFSFEAEFYQLHNAGQYLLNNASSFHSHGDPQSPTSFRKGPSSYEIKDNTIIVKAMVDHFKIAMRCKIWPTPKNFGLNKIEVTANGAFLWKKGLWWYNARSYREFTVDDQITLIAEWHVALRTSRYGLASGDPRRSQGPFCVKYLALKDFEGNPLIEYHGDRSPLPASNNVAVSLPRPPANIHQPSSVQMREPANSVSWRLRKSMICNSPQ